MQFLQNFFYAILTTVVSAFEETYTRQILLSAWALLVRLWPYVVAGIIGSALLSVLMPKKKIQSFFQRRGAVSILLASFLGLISPLSTCSVIPLCAALMMAGIPPAPLVAFLVASPLMNPNIFCITSGALGYETALLLVLFAFILSLAAGVATQLLMVFKTSWGMGFAAGSSQEAGRRGFPDGDDPATRSLSRAFAGEAVAMGRFVGKYFLPSILLASAISVLIPPTFILKMLGSDNMFSVLVAAAAGAPLYVCGGAAIPVVQELHSLGMSKGAMMAFLIAGPATKLSTLMALKAAFRTPLFFLYLAVTMAGAVGIGYLCNALM